MSNAKVEILLATYNGASYICEQLESIKSQSYPHLSLSIRDDGSSDETVALVNRCLEGWDKPWRWITTSTRPKGVVNNFATLMDHAEADYVMCSDQDDYWLPEKVERSLLEMERLEAIYGKDFPILVHSDLEVVDASLCLLAPSFWRYINIDPNLKTLNRLLIQNNVTGCALMMNRSLLKVALNPPKEVIMHDWWIALCAAAFGTIGVVETPLIRYRQHATNQLGAKKIWQRVWEKGISAYWKGACQHVGDLFRQAEAFHLRYASELSEENREIAEAFIRIPRSSLLQRRKLVLKHQFIRANKKFVFGMFCLMNLGK